MEPRKSELILYQTENGKTKVEVRLQDETVWLSQKLMAELFQTSVPNVNMHISNIFVEGELAADSVIKDFLTTAADGKNYQTKFYNLDVIIS
ncbi:MAG: hydroxyacid dehydrogenase, partial [Chloroflexi bacterium]|nr:hydroxyacid dehydrogenase [Chloroflexota bacterium]